MVWIHGGGSIIFIVPNHLQQVVDVILEESLSKEFVSNLFQPTQHITVVFREVAEARGGSSLRAWL